MRCDRVLREARLLIGSHQKRFPSPAPKQPSRVKIGEGRREEEANCVMITIIAVVPDIIDFGSVSFI